MKTLFWTLFFTLFASITFGQSILEETGDKFVKHGTYNQAIEMYLRAYERDSSNVVCAKLGFCYRELDNPKESVYWYDRVEDVHDLPNEHSYYYAEVLIGMARYEDAERWYLNYNTNVIKDHRNRRPSSSKYYRDDYYKDSTLYSITNLKDINTKYAEYSTVMYDKNTLVFCSDRPDEDNRGIFKRKGEELVDLFQMNANLKDTSFSKLKRFHKELKTKHHAGPVIFNKDRSEVIFTRSTFFPGKDEETPGVSKLHLYHAVRNDKGDWDKAVSLPFNDESYSTGHPAMNDDFTIMYFASDMPGGVGATDLYQVSYQDGVWGKPENLGNTINTPQEEMFPTFDRENHIYFSSTGHNSIGGLDIFEANLKEDKHEISVKNMGFPLNSSEDDFGLVWTQRKRYGFFSSTRADGKGSDDIYFLSSAYVARKARINGDAFIKNQGELDEKRQRVVCKIVIWDQKTNLPVDTVYTNKFGQFSILLDLGTTYNFVGKKNNARKDLLVNLEVENYPKHIHLTLERPLHIERDPAMYDVEFDEDTLLADNMPTNKPHKNVTTAVPQNINTKKVVDLLVHSDETNKPLSNVEVYIFNPAKKKFYRYKTNNSGYVKIPVLSDNQNLYLHRVNLAPEAVKINTKGLSEGLYVNEEPIKMVSLKPHNKFTFTTVEKDGSREKKVYFEYNKFALTPDAKKDLDKVVAYLKKHQTLQVELASHTDSRGGNAYNQNLSLKRSKAAVAYIVSKGIDKSRIKATGYGETQLVNKCRNEIECSEQDHQLNRRTEVKITGKIQIKKKQKVAQQDLGKFNPKKLISEDKINELKIVRSKY